MKEILGVGDEPQTQRRWFHDEFFDLFVWQTRDGEVTLFQLCYGMDSSERALVWSKHGGLFHDGAEPGTPGFEEFIGSKLRPGDPLSADPVGARFEETAASLPPDIRDIVTEKILEYSAKRWAVPSRRKRFRRAAWQRRPPGSVSEPGSSEKSA